MVIRVLWTPLAAKEYTMSSVAYYIPIDQHQADELRHSADASAWAEEKLEEAVLNEASIIDDQQWMGMYFALDRNYKGIQTIDGNNKDSIEDVPEFIAKLQEGYDLVQGSRVISGGHAINTPPVL